MMPCTTTSPCMEALDSCLCLDPYLLSHPTWLTFNILSICILCKATYVLQKAASLTKTCLACMPGLYPSTRPSPRGHMTNQKQAKLRTNRSPVRLWPLAQNEIEHATQTLRRSTRREIMISLTVSSTMQSSSSLCLVTVCSAPASGHCNAAATSCVRSTSR